jgi:hypothetical protein
MSEKKVEDGKIVTLAVEGVVVLSYSGRRK